MDNMQPLFLVKEKKCEQVNSVNKATVNWGTGVRFPAGISLHAAASKTTLHRTLPPTARVPRTLFWGVGEWQ